MSVETKSESTSADGLVAAGEHTETDLCDALSSMKTDWSSLDPTTTSPEYVREHFRETYVQQINEMKSVNEKVQQLHEQLHPAEQQKYDVTKFNSGIRALGIDAFLAAAAQFCKDESGPVIVSVGSSNGFVEEKIVRAHHQRFGGQEISIKLIDPDPSYQATVDFTSVDQFVGECPEAVGNCVVLIVWPDGEDKNEGYDEDALRKLQPLAAFVLYEALGSSGSERFRAFLHDDSVDDLEKEEYGANNWGNKVVAMARTDRGLDNYLVEEVARQKMFIGPASGTIIFRLVKLKRSGPARPYEAKESQSAEKEKQDNEVAKVTTSVLSTMQTTLAEELVKKGAAADNVRDELNATLKKLGLYDRRHDLDYIIEQAKVDYTSLDVTNDIHHAKIMLNAHLSFTELPDLRAEIIEQLGSRSNNKKGFSKYKDGVLAIGVERFLSAAVQFCKESKKKYKVEIVSVGTTDTFTERQIDAAYKKQSHNKSTSVSFRLVDAVGAGLPIRDVDDLIKKRPYLFRHCSLLLLWPERAGMNQGYDIEAIRELQPVTVLIVYENTGCSGSHILREFLHEDSLDLSPSSEEFGFQNFLDQACRAERSNGVLQNYAIEELAREKVRIRPVSGTFTIRMVKLTRTD